MVEGLGALELLGLLLPLKLACCCSSLRSGPV